MSGDNQGAEPGTLYLVATPLGNLFDITLRALEILRTVDIIAAEDTRTTRKLLSRYEIKAPKLLAYHEHNEVRRAREIVKFLEKGKSVALVSEAGTPGISDPGAYLVNLAHQKGLSIRPIPGPSAVATALSCAGFELKEGFVFIGFLPAKAAERRRWLEELRGERRPMVFYEAPHRLLKTLTDMLNIFGEREAFLAREMTKVHEEYRRGSLSQFKRRFEKEAPRGEFTLVVKGVEGEPIPSEEDIKARLKDLLDQGLSTKEAAQRTAQELGLPRSRIYPLALELLESN